jgi:hypothetical protein
MDWELPDEPFLTLGDAVTPDDSNVPVGRLADAYNRDIDKAFLKPIHRDDNLTKDGYALSQDILDKLRLHRVESVFVLERDTDLVLEFGVVDFTHQLNETEYFIAKENEANYRWPELGFDLFSNETIWGK